MKLNSISYTLFLFVMILFFPSLILGPWTKKNPPKEPTDGIPRSCAQWIEFNGFTLDTYEENIRRANKRNYKLDKRATTWSAIYAFIIAGEVEIPNIFPQTFCDSFGDENQQPKPFLALENERKTCDKWITLYRFSEDHPNNLSLALNQKHERVSAISIWAHIYYLYVVEFGIINPLTPIDFCMKIGKSVVDIEENRMKFMSENDTLLTCHDWIYLYEFTDNPVENNNKAIHYDNESQNYRLFVHYFPINYAKKLLKEGISDVMTPQVFCREYNGEGAEPIKYGLGYLGLQKY